MNERARFIRKVAYGCAIAVLLLPLYWLSQPATTESQGGILAQMRQENQLSQASLGEIDPASETIKLATLGMRGVAANFLWEKAHRYRRQEDWVNLSATLEQIAKLQPNFISVWVFQGWNLSYNISVEFDDYRDRYYWVIRGIDFLKEGTTYNKKEPRLNSEIGWTIAQKIGRADEHLQYRRLFREDDDFNGSRPRAQRDNWLVGREYLLEAEGWVDREGLSIKGKSPLLFHSHPVMCLINYAEAIEEEGTFGEVAKNAWNKASDSWAQFSRRDLPTTHNIFIRLADKEAFDQRSKDAQEVLARLTPPGLREKILGEKVAQLSEAEKDAYDTPESQRTSEQNNLLYMAQDRLSVGHLEIADRITGPDRAAALKAAEDATQADFVASAIDGERDVINYDYWMRRCQIEPRDDTLAARKTVYDADAAFAAAQLVKSRDLYNDGLAKWRKVLDANRFLLEDPNLVEELAYSIGRYTSVLHQLDEKLPDDFILKDVLDANERFTGRAYPGAPVRSPASAESADPSKASAEPEPPANPPADAEPAVP
jgi:hypothetical protein